MVLNKTAQPVLRVLMTDVDAHPDEEEAVVVTSIVTAELWEGKNMLRSYKESMLSITANPKSKQHMVGVPLKAVPNSLMSKLVKLLLMPTKRRP